MFGSPRNRKRLPSNTGEFEAKTGSPKNVTPKGNVSLRNKRKGRMFVFIILFVCRCVSSCRSGHVGVGG